MKTKVMKPSKIKRKETDSLWAKVGNFYYPAVSTVNVSCYK